MRDGTAEKFDFGEKVEGIDIPVVNERAVRASAGILFLLGFSAVSSAFFTGDFQPVRGFAILFLIDMGIRIGLDHRFAPSMVLGALIVRRQRPEWVGAAQKRVAWSLGFGMASVACLGMGFLGLQNEWMLLFCSVCLSLMFLETAFGICVGCELYRVFAKDKAQLCPGDVCTYTPPTRRSLFSQEPRLLDHRH
ncbi:MAG: DUF4395 domain-containing protein [Microbacteriaceae bacterium]|jgi:hypothetical protein|nr:DUF4395 domain-containing protein [Microbacteriaceae bacterium]